MVECQVSRTPTTTSSTSQGANAGEQSASYQAARAKCQRLCTANVQGALKVDPAIHKMWLAKGAEQEKLIQTMMEANGNKEGVGLAHA